MNGEDLVYDWEHNVVAEASEWAFNWECAKDDDGDGEGSRRTVAPTAQMHHATMWITVNVDRPINAVRDFFNDAQSQFPILKFKAGRDRNGNYALTVSNRRTKSTLMKGTLKDRKDSDNLDSNVGQYAVFRSTSKEATEIMQTWVDLSILYSRDHESYGGIACIPHERIEFKLDVDPSYRIVSVTGTVGNDGNDEFDNSLATRFTLFHEDEEVARCHITYREDRSWDPCIGPTIEMLAVKQSRRGEGLAMVLWYWVRNFIAENFTLECLNREAPQDVKYIMTKATEISQQEVEIRKEKRDGSMHPLGFKEFLYDFCGFSAREIKGADMFVIGSGRPKDAEAVLYIPFLDRDTILERRRRQIFTQDGASSTSHNIPTRSGGPRPGNAIMREKCGKRMCQWCMNLDINLQRCSRCGVAFYCNPECQKNDWKRHKKWCNKTNAEVRQLLIDEGHMQQADDGSYNLVADGPSRSFFFSNVSISIREDR